MKTLEKIALIIFSNVIIILSIIGCLVLFGWLTPADIATMIESILEVETAKNVCLGVFAVFILLGIRCIFFDKTSKERAVESQGILLENENGRLLISKETVESLVISVTNGFKDTTEVQTKVELDKENKVIANINLVVTSEVSIKELTLEIQNKIKEKVKSSTDLEVKQVNVTIKKVGTEKEA